MWGNFIKSENNNLWFKFLHRISVCRPYPMKDVFYRNAFVLATIA
ncbi:hypothetical protein LEP1GSC165_2376 [Leptospira santarosai str. CBC523]|nr:hypothetical protein LEP1GSC165_2376 [Leptospira santarosai str. CBC523]